MTCDRILTKGLILNGAELSRKSDLHLTESILHLAPSSPHRATEFLVLFCWYLPVLEISEREKTPVRILTLLLPAFQHRNYSYLYGWAVPILTEIWPWLQHHLNLSLLALQKLSGNLTRTCFPGSLLTSYFCSHPEIGSRKQTKTFIWTFQAFHIILFFSLKKEQY